MQIKDNYKIKSERFNCIANVRKDKLKDLIRLTLNVDLGGRTLNRVAGFLVHGHTNKTSTVQDPTDPGDVKIALDLMPPRTGSKRLSVHFPRVLNMRAWLSLASQANRRSFDDRMFRGTHRKKKIAILTMSECHCKKKSVILLIIK